MSATRLNTGIPIVIYVTVVTAGVPRVVSVRTCTPRIGGDHVHLDTTGLCAHLCGHAGHWRVSDVDMGNPGLKEQALRYLVSPSSTSWRNNICASRSAGRMPSLAVLVPFHAATVTRSPVTL